MRLIKWETKWRTEGIFSHRGKNRMGRYSVSTDDHYIVLCGDDFVDSYSRMQIDWSPIRWSREQNQGNLMLVTLECSNYLHNAYSVPISVSSHWALLRKLLAEMRLLYSKLRASKGCNEPVHIICRTMLPLDMNINSIFSFEFWLLSSDEI